MAWERHSCRDLLSRTTDNAGTKLGKSRQKCRSHNSGFAKLVVIDSVCRFRSCPVQQGVAGEGLQGGVGGDADVDFVSADGEPSRGILRRIGLGVAWRRFWGLM